MTDPNLDIARLSSRISALEKANRRWKMGGLILFVVFVAAASLTGYRAYAQMSVPAMPKAVAKGSRLPTRIKPRPGRMKPSPGACFLCCGPAPPGRIKKFLDTRVNSRVYPFSMSEV
jgi:hypothetical protein